MILPFLYMLKLNRLLLMGNGNGPARTPLSSWKFVPVCTYFRYLMGPTTLCNGVPLQMDNSPLPTLGIIYGTLILRFLGFALCGFQAIFQGRVLLLGLLFLTGCQLMTGSSNSPQDLWLVSCATKVWNPIIIYFFNAHSLFLCGRAFFGASG